MFFVLASNFPTRIFMFLFLLLVVSSAFAQESTDSIRVYELQEVSITAESNKEVIPAQKLTGAELERLNSQSVADAIRYFSGVQLKDYGGVGGIKTVDIRSMGTNQMGVFYDGIQLGNAQNGQIDLGKFSLDNIAEISLYNGQKSEIFQSAKDFGSAGTIYLKTQRPVFKDDKKTNLRAVFRTGSFGLANPSILWEQKLSEKVSSSFNAEYTSATGKYKFKERKVNLDGTVAWDTTAIRQNGDVEAIRFEGGLNGIFNTGNWNAKAYFYNSERGIPGAIVNNVWKNSQRQWDRNFFVQGSFKKFVGKKYSLLFNAKYAHDYMRYLNPDTTLMYINNTFNQQEAYFSVANKYSILENWDINLSVDFQWNSLDANLTNFAYPERYTGLVALATAFEWRRVKMQASILGTFIHETVQTKGATASPDKAEYTPAVFLSYQPFKNAPLNFRAFYKKIFRMPTFNDLYYTDIGNVQLKPEYTTQYNVGLEYTKSFKKSFAKSAGFQMDAYYNTVTDKIIAVPKGTGQYRWMMMNIGNVEIRGLDVSGNASFLLPHAIGLNLNVTYTYQKAQDFTDPTDNDPVAGTYGGQIAYIPWHSGSAIVGINYKSWDLNYSFIYVGERYHTSSNILQNYEQPWYTSDMSIGKEFKMWKLRTKLTFEVNNLFDQAYEVILNYPMPGRNYKAILKIEF